MTKAIIRIRNDGDALLAEAGERFKAAWRSGEPFVVFYSIVNLTLAFMIMATYLRGWNIMMKLSLNVRWVAHVNKFMTRHMDRPMFEHTVLHPSEEGQRKAT